MSVFAESLPTLENTGRAASCPLCGWVPSPLGVLSVLTGGSGGYLELGAQVGKVSWARSKAPVIANRP